MSQRVVGRDSVDTGDFGTRRVQESDVLQFYGASPGKDPAPHSEAARQLGNHLRRHPIRQKTPQQAGGGIKGARQQQGDQQETPAK